MTPYKTTRDKLLLNKVLFINGQPGCGKTLFTSILPTMNKVELLNYCTEIENICALYYLKKISKDGASAFIKTYLDETLYNTCMSRKVNFRITDLSSAFRDPYWIRYIIRLFNKGDQFIPKFIIDNKPILHFATHNLLPYSKILFETLSKKILFIEILRHPLYMIKQQFLNYENLLQSSRHFHINIKKSNKEYFFWDAPYIEKKLNFNPIDMAINHLCNQLSLQIKMIKILDKKYPKNFLVISFEEFVINPSKYLDNLEKFIGEDFTNKISKVLKREKIPRKKLADGINLKIYKRLGWEAGEKELSEEMELEKRMEFVKSLKPLNSSLHNFYSCIKKYDAFIKNRYY